MNQCTRQACRIGVVHVIDMPGVEAPRPGTDLDIARMQVIDERVVLRSDRLVYRAAGIVEMHVRAILIRIFIDVR